MALLTAAEARSRVSRGGMPLDADKYPNTWIDEVVAEFEGTFQRYRGETAASATVTEVVRAVGVSDHLLLRWPVVSSVTSVTVNGTAVTSTDYYVEAGIIRRIAAPTSHWVSLSYPATVIYVHGYGSPADLKRACALYVEKCAAADSSGQTRDVRSSGDQVTYSMPDWNNGRPTGWADVDRILNTYPDHRFGVA